MKQRNALKVISYCLIVLNDERENQKILCKCLIGLFYFGEGWCPTTERSDVFPPFHEFVNFMVKELNIANDPITSL